MSIVVTTFVGGFTSGYLGRMCCPHHHLGTIYGFTTWVVALMLSAIIATHVGNYVDNFKHNVSATVVMDNNASGPIVKAKSKETSAPAQNVQIIADKKDMAMSALVLFALFFLGALFSCLGAAWAFCCDKSRCCKPQDDVIVTSVNHNHL